ncbi:uncharacterized protein LOC112083462 [Eutrema salsugineum]|uniref:uncharacterized protein LOC112083462 n=1 Tax=Eutrema salsugineum TaxID=72664 RepID=UPI000CED59F3|nr:uncharacterized protein LOC112083462 [Eutrema salsugineum]
MKHRLGIHIHATLGSVMHNIRRRRHCNTQLRQVEEAIRAKRNGRILDKEDTPLWHGKRDNYKEKFSSKNTSDNMRIPNAKWDPYFSIWFSSATPKYSFVVVWLVTKNRLTTGDRMAKWNTNVNSACVLCGDLMETRDHLFFECTYSGTLWKALAGRLMGTSFTTKWADFVEGMSQPLGKSTTSFILRYVFHAAIHSIWCERNNRRHGERHTPRDVMFRHIDRVVRNRLSTTRNKYGDGLQTWFGLREDP